MIGLDEIYLYWTGSISVLKFSVFQIFLKHVPANTITYLFLNRNGHLVFWPFFFLYSQALILTMDKLKHLFRSLIQSKATNVSTSQYNLPSSQQLPYYFTRYSNQSCGEDRLHCSLYQLASEMVTKGQSRQAVTSASSSIHSSPGCSVSKLLCPGTPRPSPHSYRKWC